MNENEKKERIEELTAKINDAKERYPDYDEISWDNIIDDELRRVKNSMPRWEAELEQLEKELSVENDIETEEVVEENIDRNELETDKVRYERFIAEYRKLEENTKNNPDLTPEEKAKKLENINATIGMWERRIAEINEKLGITKDENVNTQEETSKDDLSVEEINAMLEQNKKELNDLYRTVMAAGDAASPEEQAEWERLNATIKELEERLKSESIVEQDGISKDKIRDRIAKCDQFQKDVLTYSDGEDTMPEKDSKEFDRINNVKPVLEELLNKNPELDYVSLEDINALIEENKNTRRELWERVGNSGEGAIPQEEAQLRKLNDIIKELEDLSKEIEKIEINKNNTTQKEDKKPKQENKDDSGPKFAEDGFKPPAVVNTEKQPPAVRDLPELNLKINKKTGQCILTDGTVDEKGNLKIYETQMDSEDYTRAGLKGWRNTIISNENISDEDKKYIKAVDPTIYNAYLEYDRANEGKYDTSAAEMYVNAVIAKAREIDTLKLAKDVKMPGKVEVDIGWHPNMEDQRSEDVSGFKKLKYLLASHRANKILKKHGDSGAFIDRMELAKVKDNRGLFAAITSGLAVLGATAFLRLNSPEQTPEVPDNEPKIEHETEVDVSKNEMDEPIVVTPEQKPEQNPDKDSTENVQNGDEKDDVQKDTKQEQENNRIYPGDIVNADGMLYNSSDDKKVDGALSNRVVGVNKISVVIGDEILSTANGKYTADQIYDMAEKAGVDVNYHVDKAMVMNGKTVVQVQEVGNPSPVYIYNENGVPRRMDGREFTGDVQYGNGWMRQGDVTKADEKTVQEFKEAKQAENNQQSRESAQQENDVEHQQ